MQAVDISQTIVPKSDQLNADDLLACTKEITVTEVKLTDSEQQPVSIHYNGDDDRPYKPCKSMRRVLIAAWGPRADQWTGRSMRLYCDPDVKFGGSAVGGIRISHLSHIDQPKTYMLTVTRGRRSGYTVKTMEAEQKPPLPDDLFNEKLPSITEWIKNGDGTPEQAIVRLSTYGEMTKQQRETVRSIENPTE